jgi:hypothetical protein
MKKILAFLLFIYLNSAHANYLCYEQDNVLKIPDYNYKVRKHYYNRGVWERDQGLPGVSKTNRNGEIICGCSIYFESLSSLTVGLKPLEWEYNDIINNRPKGFLTHEIIEIIRNSTSQYGGCPTQEGFDLIYTKYKQLVIEKDKQDWEIRESNYKALNQKNDKLTLKFCKGLPQIYTYALENFSNSIAINPRNISLERVELIKNPVNFSRKFECTAIFYTPKGVYSKTVDFNDKGIIIKTE